MKSAENTLWYNQAATAWNESLPLGNDRIGAMVFGGAKCEKICLNQDTLWSGYPRVSDKPDTYKAYFEAQKLVLNGENQKVKELIESQFGDFWVQMYLPLGDINLTMSHDDKIGEYKRELSLENAMHTVSYTVADKRFSRQTFISAPAQVLAMKISCAAPNSVGFSLELNGKLKCNYITQNGNIIIEGNCPVCLAPVGEDLNSDDKKYYFQDDERKGIGYRAAVRVATVGGTISIADSIITVENADSAIIYFAVRTSFNVYNKHPVLDGKPYKEKCIKDLDKAASIGFDALFKDSIQDYQLLYNRVFFNFGENSNSQLPTDERLYVHEKGEKDNALYTLLFNYGRYLTIAGSKEETQATNLQGIWNDQLIPPWSSNYTLNINIEMNY